MMKNILLLLTLLCTPCFASNLSFLNYSALYYLTEQDANMMEANLLRALNTYPDGKKAAWRNPETGAYGYAIPSKSNYAHGYRCRELLIYNNAKDVPGESQYRLCKINGVWRYAE